MNLGRFFRVFRVAPAFAFFTVFLTALSTGTNTAVYCLVRSALLQPLPYPGWDRLYYAVECLQNTKIRRVPYRTYERWHSQQRSFDELATVLTDEFILLQDNRSTRFTGGYASASYFDVMGLRPLLGRFFDERDNRSGTDVVVINERAWRSRFGADPSLVSRRVVLNGRSREVIGVAPKELDDPAHLDWYAPLQGMPDEIWNVVRSNGAHDFQCVGRLKPGVTPAEAQAELGALALPMKAELDTERSLSRVELQGVLQTVIGGYATVLWTIAAAAVCLLLITCLNTSSLLLAHTASQEHRIAVLGTLGASPVDTFRSVVTQSLFLTALGAVAGIPLCTVVLRGMRAVLPNDASRLQSAGLDGTAFGFLVILSCAVAFLFGLVPAWRAARIDLYTALKGERQNPAPGMGTRRLREVLVVAQLALATALLASAGTALRNVLALSSKDLGLDPRPLVMASVGIPFWDPGTQASQNAYFDELQGRLARLPGVRSVAVSSGVPFAGETIKVRVSLTPGPASGEEEYARYEAVSPGYFHTMGIALLQGREISVDDRQGSDPVVIIDRTFAARYFPYVDPIGKRVFGFGPGSEPSGYRVVGVVGDVHRAGLGEDPAALPQVYFAYAQNAALYRQLCVRCENDPDAMKEAMRRAIEEAGPKGFVVDLRTMDELLSGLLSTRRLLTGLVGIFAVAAVGLAACGVYATLSYVTAGRTREIGLRLILGADPVGILRLIVAHGVALAAIGCLAGLLLGGGAIQLLGGIFTETAAPPLGTLLIAPCLLLAVAALASLGPARRAMTVDPLKALRHA